MWSKFALAFVLGTAAALPLAGCHSVPNAPGVRVEFGNYITRIGAPPDAGIEAARDVINDMKLRVVIYSATKVDGKLVAQSATDKTYTIITHSAGERVSDLEVKIGNGDKEASLALIDKIKAKL